MNVLTRFSYSRQALALGRERGEAVAAVERLAAGEELAVHGGRGRASGCLLIAHRYAKHVAVVDKT